MKHFYRESYIGQLEISLNQELTVVYSVTTISRFSMSITIYNVIPVTEIVHYLVGGGRIHIIIRINHWRYINITAVAYYDTLFYTNDKPLTYFGVTLP